MTAFYLLAVCIGVGRKLSWLERGVGVLWGTGVRIPVTAIIFSCAAIHFLDAYDLQHHQRAVPLMPSPYGVWEVKDILSRVKCRHRLSPARLIHHVTTMKYCPSGIKQTHRASPTIVKCCVPARQIVTRSGAGRLCSSSATCAVP